MCTQGHSILISILLGLCVLSPGSKAQCKEKQSETSLSKIRVIPIEGMIDLGVAAFVQRMVKTAISENASAVILEIDTEGGLVEAALLIARAVEQAEPRPTVAFVRDRAWSAGALIALSCKSIVMAPASTIGSATPVTLSPSPEGGGTEALGEKYVSAIRAKFKALAERNDHPVLLAAAMVDSDVGVVQVSLDGEIQFLTPEDVEAKKAELGEDKVQVLKTVSPTGKLLNLTAQESVDLGLAEGPVQDLDAALSLLGLEGMELVQETPSWSEGLTRMLTHPVVSGLLLTVGVLALVLELKAPGWGLAGTCGILCLALFFGGRYMAGLAEWTEALVFLAGVTLLALEIFVIPGFGIVGISGMALMVLSFYLMMVDQPLPQVPWEWKVTEQSIQIISMSLFMAFVAGAAAVRILPHTPLWKKVGLVFSLSSDEGCVAGTEGLSQYLGQSGVSASVLRPVGRGRFGSALVDVSTQGEFVETGRPIKVIDIRGNVLVVEKV